jgi:hypothetical protein
MVYLEIEATCFSETSTTYQHTTQHYIPGDRNVQFYCCMRTFASGTFTEPLPSNDNLSWLHY